MPVKLCCRGIDEKQYKKATDQVYLDKMQQLHTHFYDNLEVSKRAIANWKKLRILLVLLKVCGGRLSQNNAELTRRQETEQLDNKGPVSCAERIAPYIINPTNYYKVSWDLLVGFVYACCYVLDPYVFAFDWDPYVDNISVNRWQRFISYFLLADIIITPFTAVNKEEHHLDKKDSGSKKNKRKQRVKFLQNRV